MGNARKNDVAYKGRVRVGVVLGYGLRSEKGSFDVDDLG
jgi:hypothetical protein